MDPFIPPHLHLFFNARKHTQWHFLEVAESSGVLYLHLFSGKLFVLLSAEFLLCFDLGSVTDQLPKNAKLYGEILLNGFRQRLSYGTYVNSWALFFLSPYVSPASRKLVSLSISISIELLDQN